MSLVDTSLLKHHDDGHLKKLDALRKKTKFPKGVETVHQQNVHLTEKLLRPYFTLASDVFKQDGLIRKTTKSKGRQFIKNNLKKHKADNKLLRRRLRVLDIGKMFTFLYNPKFREILPYYDKMPLVIPLELHDNGFTGLNMHLINPHERLRLLNKFKRFKTLSELRTHIRMTFKIIKRDDKYRFARPIIRRYLYSNTKSLIVLIPESDWDIMQILPSLNFAKRKDTSVWLDNRIKALRS